MIGAFLAMAVATGTAMVLASWLALWQRQLDPTRADWSMTLPHLGGHEPDTHAWNRFHARYYPMALVLMAFEMEMMFMYPWAVVFVAEGIKALAEMGMFLTILSVGILYGWREGIFRWE